MSKTLYLLDGMALVYRAHFAFISRPILTSGGRNVSAIFGFANTLLEILEKQRPSHLAVAFDTSAPTARHERYPEYKAQREAMPEDLSAAIPDVKRLLAAMRIPVLELDGYEADDLIGTLARQAESEGFSMTYMVTPDKDFGQLVDTHTRIYKPGRQGNEVEILGPAEVCAQWGIERPQQVIDLLGLMGDSSDNIPGVPGVGPKTAQKLLAEYDNLDNLLEHAAEVKGKVGEKLQEFADQARLSRDLATIDVAVPVPESLDDLQRGERDDEALQALLKEFEFQAMGRRLFGEGFAARGTAPQEAPQPMQGDLFDTPAASGSGSQHKTLADVPHRYHGLESPGDLQVLWQAMETAEAVCFDLETTDLDPLEAKVVGVAFAAKAGEAFFVRLDPEREAEALAALETRQRDWESGPLQRLRELREAGPVLHRAAEGLTRLQQQLDAQEEKYEAQLQALRERADAAEAMREAAEHTHRETLAARVAALEAAHSKALASLEADLNASAEGRDQVVAQLREELAALTVERDALGAQVDTLQKELAQLTAERDALAETAAAAERNLKAQEKMQAELTDTLTTLKTAQAGLTGERDSLQAQVKALLEDQQALSGERDGLLEKLGGLSSDQTALTAARDGLAEQVASLEAGRAELEAQLAEAQAGNAGLKQAVAEQSAQVAALQQSLESATEAGTAQAAQLTRLQAEAEKSRQTLKALEEAQAAQAAESRGKGQELEAKLHEAREALARTQKQVQAEQKLRQQLEGDLQEQDARVEAALQMQKSLTEQTLRMEAERSEMKRKLSEAYARIMDLESRA